MCLSDPPSSPETRFRLTSAGVLPYHLPGYPHRSHDPDDPPGRRCPDPSHGNQRITGNIPAQANGSGNGWDPTCGKNHGKDSDSGSGTLNCQLQGTDRAAHTGQDNGRRNTDHDAPGHPPGHLPKPKARQMRGQLTIVVDTNETVHSLRLSFPQMLGSSTGSPRPAREYCA